MFAPPLICETRAPAGRPAEALGKPAWFFSLRIRTWGFWLGVALAVGLGVAGASPTRAQHHLSYEAEADSLLRQLPLVNDTAKVRVLLKLCRAYYSVQPTQAERYGVQARALAERLQWPRGIALALETLGMLHAPQDYFRAQQELMQALEMWKKQANVRHTMYTKNALALVLEEVGEYTRAKEIRQQALRVAKEYRDTAWMTHIYIGMGTTCSKARHTNEAIVWFRNALHLAQVKNDRETTAFALNNLADSYVALGQPRRALPYLFQALPLARAGGRKGDIAATLGTIAQAYQGLHQPARSLPYILEAYRLASQGQENDLVIEFDQFLATLYASLGQYKQAYRYAQHGADLQQKLFNASKARSFADLQTRYETQEKERKIQLLTQRNQIQQLAAAQERTVRNAALLSSGLLLLAVGLVYNRYQLRQRTVRQLNAQARTLEKQDQEKSLLLKEVHHRVKNNLQIVLSLLRSQLRTLHEPAAVRAIRESQSRLQTMALIHQNLYQTEDLARINMARYLADLVGAIQQTFRTEAQSVRVELDVPALHLNTHTAVPLGLVVNELVTNALKYAFPSLDKTDKCLCIALHPVGAELFHLVVADNGVGLPPLDLEHVQSLGLRLVVGLLDQIGATLTINRENGARLEVLFHEVVVDELTATSTAYA